MIRLLLHIALLPLLVSGLHAQRMEMVIDLRGSWRFEIGDDLSRAEADYDDSSWDRIRVPAFWEDQGYPGYDGWAWYRTRFVLSASYRHEALHLRLGNIDDVDEVYVNGRLVGFAGAPPPHYETAYQEERWYYVPTEYLRFGEENVLAVRVYDNELGGGIIRGAIGLYRERSYLVPDQSLRGPWRFIPGDYPAARLPGFDDSGWSRVLVPIYWETQGYRDLDGFGWYRRDFTLDAPLEGKRLILLLGRIDDADEVWLNGTRIGKTGEMPEDGGWHLNDDAYRKLRAYFIPPKLLRSDRNVIAVRVYDGFRHGGIYSGPVGIVRQDRFRSWQQSSENDERSGIEKFFDALIGR